MHMHGRDIMGRAILNLREAAKIGTVADLVTDPASRRLAGFVVEPLDNKAGRWMLPYSIINSIGRDAITLQQVQVPPPADPGFVNLPRLEALRRIKVVTAGGTFLGHLNDLLFDTDTGEILQYELEGNLLERLTGRECRFPAEQVSSFSGDLMIVPNEVAES